MWRFAVPFVLCDSLGGDKDYGSNSIGGVGGKAVGDALKNNQCLQHLE